MRIGVFGHGGRLRGRRGTARAEALMEIAAMIRVKGVYQLRTPCLWFQYPDMEAGDRA